LRRLGWFKLREETMSYSGGIQPLYGVIIHDKIKSASTETLRAYKVVGEDLLKDAGGGKDAEELREALRALDAKLGGQGGTKK
jgi:hypothetical protein